MKLLQVYNQYRSPFNGEEAVVEQTARLIESYGGKARLLMRSSRDIGTVLSNKLSAFCSGIYSWTALKEMERMLRDDRPDVVHVHNLYPLLSPSVLVACRRAGVPVVVSVHNHQFTCPTSNHLYRGEICERCLGGGEYNCVLRNCRDNILESLAYATRSAVARRLRFFHDNVTLFIALCHSAKERLVRAGYKADRIVVLPNMVSLADAPVDPATGRYALFAGRLSPEKGVSNLLAAARRAPELRLRVAGDGPMFDQLQSELPTNTTLLGQLAATEMTELYREARFFVLPSTTYEMCPLVILEAMSHGLPVIVSRSGGQGELVRDGITGLLFEPGSTGDLHRQMKRLWRDPRLCRQMGHAGYEIVRSNHTGHVYYQRLIEIYNRAIAQTTTRLGHVSL